MNRAANASDPIDEPLDDPVLNELFTALRGIADRPAPPINRALADILAGARPLKAAKGRRSRAARAGIIGLVSAGIIAGGVGAAAANELPRPAQRVVAIVLNRLTPFDVPNPDEKVPVEHQTENTIDNNVDPTNQDGVAPGQGAAAEVDQGATGNQSVENPPGAQQRDSNDQGSSGGAAPQQGSEQDSSSVNNG